jgi:hypothetical protein
MAVHLFQPQINANYNPDNFVGFHTLLESISISISATISFYGLKSYGKSQSSRLLLLSFTFFLVGTLDLLHTLSFKGMPYFITESSVAKATWFWVVARFIQSLLILSNLLIPERKLKRDYQVWVFLLGFFMVTTIGFSVIYFEKSLPLLVVEGQGTTFLKNGIEYVVCFILFVSLIITLYQYHLEKSEAKLAFALAFVYLLLTELFFTIYQTVFDLDNFTGHIFKALGLYFILKSFFFSNLNQESNRSELGNQRNFSELPGFIFKVVKRGNEFIFTFIDGELLQQFGLNHEEMVGMPLAKIFSTSKGTLNEYCHLSMRLQESIRFEMDFMEKTLLVSIKPSVDGDHKEVILGTVIVMSGVHQRSLQQKSIQEEKKNVQYKVM